MFNTTEYAENLKEVSTLAIEFVESMHRATGNSFEWGMEQMADSYISIFNRFCPFKEGDRVELLRDNTGWDTCRHFLIRGGKATVEGCGYRDGKFVFDVIFDDETWIDGDGKERDVQTNHTFSIDETYLKKNDEVECK